MQARPLPDDLYDLPDGVYINLLPQYYFGQLRYRLGSSDIGTLYGNGEGWWWSSPFGPGASTSTKSTLFGNASHTMFLEGPARFYQEFAVEPNPQDYPGAIMSAAEIQRLYGEHKPRGHSKFKAEDWFREAAVDFPDRPVFPAILADFKRSLGNRASVPAAEADELETMLAVAKRDPKIADLLFNPSVPVLAEITVFWTDRAGHRRRARLDRLYPNITLDLKNLRNWRGRKLAYALGEHIARYRLEIQRSEYDDARVMLQAHVANGDVFGGTQEQVDYLVDVIAPVEDWDWVWLFYQRPSTKGHAPVIFPLWDLKESFLHRLGKEKAREAMRTFDMCVAEFGLGKLPAADGSPSRPWARVEPVHYTDEDYDPHIASPPHWISDLDSSPEAERARGFGTDGEEEE